MSKEKNRVKNKKFGEYVKNRRLSLNLGLRELALKLEISPAYLCDVENGYRYAPVKVLNQMKKYLKITSEEEKEFDDLAYLTYNTCAPDLIAYLIANKNARKAIRLAVEKEISGEQLLELVGNCN